MGPEGDAPGRDPALGWDADLAQIYPALRRLSAAGSSRSAGAARRKARLAVSTAITRGRSAGAPDLARRAPVASDANGPGARAPRVSRAAPAPTRASPCSSVWRDLVAEELRARAPGTSAARRRTGAPPRDRAGLGGCGGRGDTVAASDLEMSRMTTTRTPAARSRELRDAPVRARPRPARRKRALSPSLARRALGSATRRRASPRGALLPARRSRTTPPSSRTSRRLLARLRAARRPPPIPPHARRHRDRRHGHVLSLLLPRPPAGSRGAGATASGRLEGLREGEGARGPAPAPLPLRRDAGPRRARPRDEGVGEAPDETSRDRRRLPSPRASRRSLVDDFWKEWLYESSRAAASPRARAGTPSRTRAAASGLPGRLPAQPPLPDGRPDVAERGGPSAPLPPARLAPAPRGASSTRRASRW